MADTRLQLPRVRSDELRRLSLVMLLTGTTMVVELVGGYLTGSLALLGDGIHMFTHLLAVGISYLAILIALRPAAPERTYRNWRAEILGSLFSGVALIPLAGYVIYEAFQRFQDPTLKIDVLPMLGVAVIGLVVNIVCALALRDHSKEDLNVRGAFLHMVADTASSVGVLVAGCALYLWPAATWLDPLVAGLISVMILIWCVGLLRQSCAVLLEAVPQHVVLEELRESMKGVSGVDDVHDLHVWTITSRMYSLTAHVRVGRDISLSETEKIAEGVRDLLDSKYHINHVTLQFEVSTGESLQCEHMHEPASEHTHSH